MGIVDHVRELKSRQVSSEIVGFSVLRSVLKSKEKYQTTYQRPALINHYKNLEASAIQNGLEQLLAGLRSPQGGSPLVRLDAECTATLRNVHEIFNVNVVYDGAIYLASRRMRDEEIAEFLGDSAYRIIAKQQDFGNSDELKMAHTAYIRNIRRLISERYNIFFK